MSAGANSNGTINRGINRNAPNGTAGRNTNTNRYSSIDIHEVMKREIMMHGPYSDDGGANFRLAGIPPQIIDSTVRSMPSEIITQDIVERNTNRVNGGSGNGVSTSLYRNNSNPNESPLLTPAWGPAVQTPTAKPFKKYPEVGIADTYVFLDSTEKEPNSDPSQGIYEYDMLKLNNGFPIENIITMEILPYYFPTVPVDASYQPDYFYFNRIFIELEDITAQQTVNTGIRTRNFHFEFNITPAGIMNYAKPLNKKFIFGRPQRDISRIRLRFKTPLNRMVTFSEDVWDVTAVIPAPGPPPANRRLQTSTPHGMPVGSTQALWFVGYNSGNEQLNSVINSVNGHLADVIDAYTVQLTTTPGAQLIATTLTLTGGIPSAKMRIGERRIAVTMRFRVLKDHSTNYVAP